MFATLKKILIKFCQILIGIIFFVVAVSLLLSINQGAQGPNEYGVTFRYPYAKDTLGLDWQKVYVSMLTDLQIKNIRIPVYWDEIEKQRGQYDWSNLDFEVQQAEKANAKIILVVGRRVPGWPECHVPGWANDKGSVLEQGYLLEEIREVVARYKDSPALQDWQVENEPFLTRFGLCPQYPVAEYLDQETALVKSNDPKHPIIITDSGELSTWIQAASHGDIFGSTLYRAVYADHFHGYIHYHLPPVFFRAKKGLVHLLDPKQEIINIELQAEPWTTKGIPSTSFEEQAITFTADSIPQNIEFARASGFSKMYLWGVEYWYWADAHGHPEFLQAAKKYLH